jgi:hypothetical protein
MKEQYNRLTEARDGGQQKLVDGQGSPTRSIWVDLVGRWSTRESVDGERESGNQRYAKGKTWWKRVNLRLATGQESVLGEFDSCMSLFLVVFVSLSTSKIVS